MKRFFSICLALSFLFSTVASADEGMWLYNEAPKDKIKAKYGFESDTAVAGSCTAVFGAV